jgi:hypothetical protein
MTTSDQSIQFYYILSLKHSKGSDALLWWGPRDCGYTIALDKAGKYSQETIEAHPSYYNDLRNTMAVKCEDAEALAHRILGREAFFQLARLYHVEHPETLLYQEETQHIATSDRA